MVKIHIEYLNTVNYALANNGVQLCWSLEIENESEDSLHNVVVECEGEYLESSRSTMMELVGEHKRLRVTGLEIVLSKEKLAEVTEPKSSAFSVTVYCDADKAERKIAGTTTCELSVLAFDQWFGTEVHPECLASFVTPAYPVVSKIEETVAKATVLCAYETRNGNDVERQVESVFGCLHDLGLKCRKDSVLQETGQRIVFADETVEKKEGNDIELTLLFASVLEKVGINCGIGLAGGKVILGVWLIDSCSQYCVTDDLSSLKNRCKNDAREMIVVDASAIADTSATFADARQKAEKTVLVDDSQGWFIDVSRCRQDGVMPMPQKKEKNGKTVLDLTTETDDMNQRDSSHYDLNNIAGNKKLTKMDIWERKLLDFSLRNSMLNLYLRQKAIQFISFDVDKIEDSLQDGNEYMIAHKPEGELNIDTEERLANSVTAAKLHDHITDDIKKHVLHTYHTETETKNTLKNIYRASRNAIEETGANSLFFTIGTMKWYETEKSEVARYAPILMLPVDIVFKKGNYYIRTREEDMVLNITLMEFLRQNYEIKIPNLNPLPQDEHGVDVKMVFNIMRDGIRHMKRWDIEEECILGVFSFSKFLMWNDIHNHRDELLENNIIRSLVEQRLIWQPKPLISDLRTSDKTMKPEDLALPVAADSSQMAAVIEAGQGNSFILYGPPGTGKSQTITNLIANALFQGKRVLFVAEKMAALSVVQKRLEKIGLGPFCLEMHSNKITKSHVMEQLGKALGVTHIIRPEEYQHTAEQLFEKRSALIEYMEALHKVDSKSGYSLHDCITRYFDISADMLSITTHNQVLKENFRKENEGDYKHLLGEKLKAVVKLAGQPSQHPLAGMNVTESNLTDVNGLKTEIENAKKVITLGKNNKGKLDQAVELRSRILKDSKESILDVDAESLYNEWRLIKTKWFLPRFFAKKNFTGKIRQYNQYIMEAEMEGFLKMLTDYSSLHKETEEIQKTILTYFGKSLKTDEMPEVSVLDNYIGTMDRWLGNMDKSRDWYQWCELKNEMEELGLDEATEWIESNTVDVESFKNCFLKTLFMNMAKEKIATSAILTKFEGSIFDETVERYKKLTEEFQLLSQKELYARLAAKIPHVSDNIESSSELGILNRNISNGGRGISLRDFLDKISGVFPRLCPCMLMSPMSVAQYLNLSQDKFDLVIFDEASQMPTSEAVGAIARGKALIVVGDPKQMPPTSFFNSTSVSEDEIVIDDMESILEDCRALEIPSLQLSWHYRSKHESLITFSNNEYYDGSLITFPSVDDLQTKVKYVHVDGIYDKGGKRCNKEEAEAIVEEIARRLKRPDHASRSIGVISFSMVQQNLIEDILQERLDNDQELKAAADEIYEPIFVKNLENVQGDERDIILFSIGYGPDKSGNVSMNFGPLNNAGGERRLNVAVSRARREMIVFSTLAPSQIDLKRTKAKGVEGLKHFLEYAETNSSATSTQNSYSDKDSIIASQVAQVLTKRGHTVKTGIGKSNFKIDVAICDKNDSNIYTMGLLLDGKGYFDTQTTRDREIVQPSVLEGLNWRIMRIWSIDWLNNPQRVTDRIEELLAQAPKEKTVAAPQQFDISEEKVEVIEPKERPYTQFEATQRECAKMSDLELVRNIVNKEQPLTMTYLCKRFCGMRGAARVTPTIQENVRSIINVKFFVEGGKHDVVVWKDRQCMEECDWYRQNHGRDITEIPLKEVKNVIAEALTEQFSISCDNLTLIVAKKLGFARRGAKVDQVLAEALEQMADNNIINNAEGKVSLINKD